jgi:hypothetical protein
MMMKNSLEAPTHNYKPKKYEKHTKIENKDTCFLLVRRTEQQGEKNEPESLRASDREREEEKRREKRELMK